MRPTPSFAWILLLTAAWGAPAQLSHAELHTGAAGVGSLTSDGAGGVQEPEQDPHDPEPEWAEERALVDEARAALERSDYPAGRKRAARAIDALLSVPLSERGESWPELLDRAGQAAWDAQDVGSAKRAWEQVLEIRSRTLPADHPDLQAARQGLAASMRSLGDLHGARALQEQVLEVRSRTLPADHPGLQLARQNLAVTIKALGDLHGARALEEEVLEVNSRTLPADHPDLQSARLNLAWTMYASGDLPGARALQEAVLEALSRTLPADHPDLQRARGNLAVTIKALGDLHGARTLEEQVLEVRSRTLPADHRGLQLARGNLAWTMASLGDLHGARALQEQVLEVFSRTLPVDHPDLQWARGNLAMTIKELGDLHGARALEESVPEVLSRTLPADHPRLQWARHSLAWTMFALGDLPGARALQEEVLEVRSRTLPADHPDLQAARGNLAATIYYLGDLQDARALQEQVLEALSRTLPAEHPDLQLARNNLALTIKDLGDIHGARALQEQVLEVLSRTLPADHPRLQLARENLALTIRALGDLPGARALLEQVLEVRSRTLPPDHPDLQRARLNLAATIKALGDLHGARALEEEMLEVRSRTFFPDHPHLQTARGNLAVTIYYLGDLQGARALQEQVLEASSRTLPPDHPDLQRARLNLAGTLARLAASADRRGESKGEGGGREREGDGEGGWPRALALVGEAARAGRAAVGMALWTASLREAEERVARGAERPLGTALSFAAGLERFERNEKLLAEAFELSEASRAAGLAAAALARAEIEPEARERLGAEIRAAGEELAGLAQRGGTREEYHGARVRREAAERELVSLAREHAREGLGGLELDAERLAVALGPERALVGFRRYERGWLAESESPVESEHARFELRSRESLGAFVLRSREGEPHLAFVDLGAAAVLEEAVQAWRSAIGVGGASDRQGDTRDVDGRGIGLDARPTGSGFPEAARLRRLVWDPLVEAIGDARNVVVAGDDVLHLVPLDALPLEEGSELVGERWRIETRVALWELLDAPRPASSREALVSLGGAAFDSQPMTLAEEGPAAPGGEEESVGAGASTAEIALLRGGAWERGFAPLAYTRTEARGLAELFAEAFDDEAPALVLDRARASRAALVEAAPRARYLHVATHGWFAPGSVRSWSDAEERSESSGFASRLGGEDTVRGMSPMLLCGLALAGANLPADALGRVPGLVTAEELSTLDLTGCELAVLSACDTNVGERRAGQGVASLQKALHMAGARSVITSLWRVPDEATRELMLDFYRRLWVEGKPKHQALWEAKMRLRDAKDQQGNPLYTLRDWAAWVLTGEPD